MDVQRESKCSVIFITFVIIGLVSAALGFATEATSPRLYEVENKITGDCKYPQSPAQSLGIAALVTLVVFRFHCPTIHDKSSKGQVCLISSWVAWLGAMSFYVVGLVMIGNQGEEIRYESSFHNSYSYSVCHVVKPAIFGVGASFVLVTIVLEIIYLVIPSV